jgi:hypothetical protein
VIVALRIVGCTAVTFVVAMAVVLIVIDYELFDNESIFGF